MSSPEDFQDPDTVWDRIERGDREDVKRSRPLLLIWTGVFLLALPGLARLVGKPLVGAALYAVIGAALAFAFAGLVRYRSSRPRP